MKINIISDTFEEVVLPGGHTIIRERLPLCPTCNQQMMNIMFYGWVCDQCDRPLKETETQL